MIFSQWSYIIQKTNPYVVFWKKWINNCVVRVRVTSLLLSTVMEWSVSVRWFTRTYTMLQTLHNVIYLEIIDKLFRSSPAVVKLKWQLSLWGDGRRKTELLKDTPKKCESFSLFCFHKLFIVIFRFTVPVECTCIFRHTTSPRHCLCASWYAHQCNLKYNFVKSFPSWCSYGCKNEAQMYWHHLSTPTPHDPRLLRPWPRGTRHWNRWRGWVSRR